MSDILRRYWYLGVIMLFVLTLVVVLLIGRASQAPTEKSPMLSRTESKPPPSAKEPKKTPETNASKENTKTTTGSSEITTTTSYRRREPAIAPETPFHEEQEREEMQKPVVPVESAREPTIETLSEQSNIVVQGTVEKIEAEWNDDKSSINSLITISISRYRRGSGDLKIVVENQGGKIGDKETIVPDAPAFNTLGEEVLLFLAREGDLHTVNSGRLGKFSLGPDDNDPRKMAADRQLQDGSSERFYLADILQEIGSIAPN